MNIVIQSVGILIILVAIFIMSHPAFYKGLLGFFKKGRRIYLAGVVRLALAVLFFAACRECDYPKVIGAFGGIFLLGAILIFAMGPKKITPILEWYEKKPLLLLRLMAVIVLAFGVAIVLTA